MSAMEFENVKKREYFEAHQNKYIYSFLKTNSKNMLANSETALFKFTELIFRCPLNGESKTKRTAVDPM